MQPVDLKRGEPALAPCLLPAERNRLRRPAAEAGIGDVTLNLTSTDSQGRSVSQTTTS